MSRSKITDPNDQDKKTWDDRETVLDAVNSGLNALAKISIILGGGVVLTYAINEGFFPELLSSFTLSSFVFFGVFASFVYFMGLLLGALAATPVVLDDRDGISVRNQCADSFNAGRVSDTSGRE